MDHEHFIYMNIIWFKDYSYFNKSLIGSKCASLGELYKLSVKLCFNISDDVTTIFMIILLLYRLY